MKKIFLSFLLCLFFNNLHSQYDNIDVSIEKVFYSPTAQTLIITTITNNNEYDIWIPGLSNVDDYGNGIEGISYIKAYAYNALYDSTCVSARFYLTRIPPYYSFNERLRPGEKYRISHLLFEGDDFIPFFKKKINGLYELEIKLHLVYMGSNGRRIEHDFVSNKITL